MNNQDGCFWSNCVIEALKRKLRHWKSIQLIPIVHGFHFHMMWYDGQLNRVRHFTNGDRCSDMFFRGRIEDVEFRDFNRWCQEHHVKLKID